MRPTDDPSPAAPRPDATALLDDPRAALLTAAGPPEACHLVGGVTRDWLLAGAVPHDWDLVVGGGGRDFAERLAGLTGGRLVEPARSRFAIFRVVAAEVRFDIWDRGETPLEDELARRDFTINSIAVDLTDGAVHDPLRGLGDLRRRLLRANRETTFLEDPLRILRLLRFELVLAGFHPTPETDSAARDAAPEIAGVAPERIREELDRILSVRPRPLHGGASEPRIGERLSQLDLHPRLWRESDAGDRGPTGPRPERPPDPDELDDWLGEAERAAGRPLDPRQLLAARHAALLLAIDPDAGPGAAESLARRGYVSKRDAGRIAHLLGPCEPPADRADERLFLHRGGLAWPARAALGAWRGDEAGHRRWHLLLPRLGELAQRDADRIFDPPPLLRGDEIALLSGIREGPELGDLVRRLRRLQVLGKIRTPEAAREWLRDRAERPGPT